MASHLDHRGFWFALIALFVPVAWWRAVGVAVNHDVATYLNVARRTQAGDVPYVDFVQVNPPLALLLYLPAVVLETLGLSAPTGLMVWVFAVVLGSATLTAYLLRDGGASVAQAGATAMGLVFIGTWFVGYDFGQREVFVVALLAPYAVLRANTSEGMSAPIAFRVGIALAAAVGIALKPHNMAIWVGIEAALLLRTQRLGPLFSLENATIVGAGALYVLGVLLLVPGYLDWVVPWHAGTTAHTARPRPGCCCIRGSGCRPS